MRQAREQDRKAMKEGRRLFFFIAPLVLLLALTGVWLALKAARENYRISLLTDQIIVAVSRARDMKIPANVKTERAHEVLMKDLELFGGMEVVSVPPTGQGDQPLLGLKGPWGHVIQLFLYPSSRAVRFEVPLSSAACRKFLFFYAKDAVSLRLQRVDIRDYAPSALWQLVYEQPSGAKQEEGISPSVIQAGCQRESLALISLTFSL